MEAAVKGVRRRAGRSDACDRALGVDRAVGQVEDAIDLPGGVLATQDDERLARTAVGRDSVVVCVQLPVFESGRAGQNPIGINRNLATQVHRHGAPSVSREAAVPVVVDDQAGGAGP